MTTEALQFIQHIVSHGVRDQAATQIQLEKYLRAISESNGELKQKKAQFLKEKTALLRKLSDDCARKKEELRKLKDEVKLIHIDLIKFSVNMGRS